MAGEVDAERLAAKLWRSRNSDGQWSWGGEDGGIEQAHAPPTFSEDEYELPPGTVRLSNPDDADEGRAIRHTHVFDSTIEEPE